MKRKVNLYFDFEMTSLSRDMEPISIGVLSDPLEICESCCKVDPYYNENDINKKSKKCLSCNEDKPKSTYAKVNECIFYGEFSDFNPKLCDDWVKHNVLSNLGKIIPKRTDLIRMIDTKLSGNYYTIKSLFRQWLTKFEEFEIQFIGDCCSWDWVILSEMIYDWNEVRDDIKSIHQFSVIHRTGLPVIPEQLQKVDISPVSYDINQDIAKYYKCSISEAFNMSREKIAFGEVYTEMLEKKHTSIYDAAVIREISHKLNLKI